MGYGCRVFCRRLENAPEDSSTIGLVDILVSETDMLLTHTYGHHVVESVLEHGLARQRSQIVAALRRGVMSIARSRTGAYVLEKAFLYCGSVDQQALAADLLASPYGELSGLMRTQLGCMVIRAMLSVQPWATQQVRAFLQSNPRLSLQLETRKHGKRLLKAAGLTSASGDSSSEVREQESEHQKVGSSAARGH